MAAVTCALRKVEDRVGGVAHGVVGAVGLGRALAGPLVVVGWRMAGQVVGQAAASASVMADGVADAGRLALRSVLPREEARARPVAVPPAVPFAVPGRGGEPERGPVERAVHLVEDTLTQVSDEEAAVAGPAQEAVEAGAPGTATAVADLAASEHPDVVVPEREQDLPVPEWDGRSPASLRARIRSLSLEDLLVLRAWEQEHAHRLQVLTSLENRIRKVESEHLGQG